MILPLLFFLFVAIPVGELYLLLEVADRMGTIHTVGLVILTGMIGAQLARQQGVKVFIAVQKDLAEARMPTDHLISGMLVLFGGALLLTPGIVTDFVGLMLLIPGNRRMCIPLLKQAFGKRFKITPMNPFQQMNPESNVRETEARTISDETNQPHDT